jgi:hypothetical protein
MDLLRVRQELKASLDQLAASIEGFRGEIWYDLGAYVTLEWMKLP